MENFFKKIKDKYPDEQLQVLQYKNLNSLCKIKCVTCNKVYTFKRARSVISDNKKYLCQDCGRRDKIKKRFIQSLKSLFPNEPFELLSFTTTQHPAAIKCKQCGRVYEYNRANFIKAKRHLCGFCNNEKDAALRKSIDNFNNYIIGTKQWKVISDLDLITSSQELIECECLLCGKHNFKSMYDYLKGIHCSCNRKKEKVNQKIKEICFLEGYKCDSLDRNNTYRDRINLMHCCGYRYSTKTQSFLQGYGRCPKCKKNGSRGERLISKWLTENRVNFIREYPVFISGRHLRMDFYLPDNDFYIEFQGKQHYYPTDFWGGDDGLKKRQSYDNLKRQYFKNNLLEIPYNQIEQINSILSLKVQRPTCTH